MCETRAHVGANLFSWDRTGQNRVITEAVWSVIEQVRTTCPLEFWFDRHDARGPHVMVLLSVPSDIAGTVGAKLQAAGARHFEGQPSSGLHLNEITERHRAASRQPLCAEDRKPGLANENTLVGFRQPDTGFPFHLTKALSSNERHAIWNATSATTEWTISQLAADPTRSLAGVGLQWLAAFDVALGRALPGTRPAFWRYFASSLLHSLPERLDTDPDGAMTAINNAVGDRNRAIFARVWEHAETSGTLWPGLGPLIHALRAAHRPNDHDTWRLPRTLVHCTLKQLGLYQQDELPMVLFALHRTLAQETPPL